MSASTTSFFKLFLKVSWLTLGLGLILEMIGFLIDVVMGQADSLTVFGLDLLKKLLWSLPLCITLISVSQRSLNMGLAGLLAAPILTLSSSLVESQLREVFLATTTEALSFASIKSAMFRGLEYGLLGFVLGYLTQRQKNTFFNHGLIGLGIGLLFGSIVVIPQLRFTAPSLDYSYSVSSPSTLAIIGQNIAELIFPVGCSLIVRITEQADS
jgi:hypothetical protein